MPIDLFADAIVTRDLPEVNLRRGDVVTVVDRHVAPDGEEGVSVETGEGIHATVVAVPADALRAVDHRLAKVATINLLIIHLSDLHLKEGRNGAAERLPFVVPAVQNVDVELDEIVVVVSGDVAWSGKADEYAIAKKEFERLRSSLQTKTGVEAVRFVFVPGNHDCNFSQDTSARDAIIEGFRKGSNVSIGPSTVSVCCEVQANFFAFIDSMPGAELRHGSDCLFYEYRWNSSGGSVVFRCYNTAWISQLREEQSKLVYPDKYLQAASKSAPADLAVSVFHHPYNWLAASDARKFRDQIERTSDLILTGHEHEADRYQKGRFHGERTEYLEGAVFQEHHVPDQCGFTAIWINLREHKQKVAGYSWTGSMFTPEDVSGGWIDYHRGSQLTTKDFDLADDWRAWLQDPGASFYHPGKPDTLVLDDVFVFPNVREFRLNDKKTTSYGPIVEGEQFLRRMGAAPRTLIFGKQQVGKTTLAKVIFNHFYQKNVIPVLLSGDDINSVELTKFEQLVERKLQAQYRNPLLPQFTQLDRDRVIIIVDDFDHTKLNAKGRLTLLHNIHARFKRVVVLGDDVLKIEEIAFGKLSTAILDEYVQYEIMEFGHLLRNRLIQKWYDIGSEYAANPEELARTVNRGENLINALLGRSYLPSYPIFILSFLQAADTSSPLNSDAGTYGSLYEVLIIKALATRTKAFNIDLKATYLSEFAFWMFSERKRYVSTTDWAEFHSAYCTKFKITPSRTELRQEFQTVGIIDEQSERYCFRHAYSYYYFVARYFRNNIHDEDVKSIVSALCDDLHKEEHASIWLFLTHLSKDPFIVDVILKHARKIFAEFNAAEFGNDVSFLVKLYEKLPEIALDDQEYDARTESRLRRLDEIKQSLKKQDAEDIQAGETLEFISKITLAIRTLEVLGQLVKNFPGSLIGKDKFDLVYESYMVGLRTIEMLLATVRDNADSFVAWFAEKVRDEHPEIATQEEFASKIRQSLFWLVEMSCFGMVKRISHAVGHSELSATYTDVRQRVETNAVRLIDVSIKLDTQGIPDSDITELNKTFKGNVLCERMLRQLVVHHFYIFPTGDRVKQKVCAELNIPIKRLREIDVISAPDKKFLPN